MAAPVTDPAHLLQRLDEIGASLASEPTALALLGLVLARRVWNAKPKSKAEKAAEAAAAKS